MAPAPGTQKEAGAPVEAWVKTGAKCPNYIRMPDYIRHIAESDLQHSKISKLMSESGLVSRASPVQTALRNCTKDEGGLFEVGNQVLISSHRKLLLSKATV